MMYIRGMMMAMGQRFMSMDMAVLTGTGIGVGMAVMGILMGVAVLMPYVPRGRSWPSCP